MPESPKMLIVLDSACIAWLKQQENASYAIRKLIHAELCKLKTGRPEGKTLYNLKEVENHAFD